MDSDVFATLREAPSPRRDQAGCGSLRRRDALFALLGLVAACSRLMLPEGDDAPIQSSAEALRQTLRCGRSAAIVGKCYVSSHPEERSLRRLTRELRADLDRVDWRDPGALRSAVSERVRRDFAEGRTVLVRGWLLSRTEARIAALYAL